MTVLRLESKARGKPAAVVISLPSRQPSFSYSAQRLVVLVVFSFV